jgi:hypothetical protein
MRKRWEHHVDQTLALAEENRKILSDAYAESEVRRQKELESNPNNGKQGLWLVTGVRHKAIVKASSAIEATDKAENTGTVGDWEFSDAEYIGEQLPDVYGV